MEDGDLVQKIHKAVEFKLINIKASSDDVERL